MHPARCRAFGLILLVAGLVPTVRLIGQTPAPAEVVTPREQNALRAEAYKAENEGRYAAAADSFLKLSRSAPERIDWLVAAARCLGRSGRFGEAIDLLEAGRKRFPGDIEIAAMLARTLILRTEREAAMVHPEISWADAAEIAEEVLQADPNHLDSRLLLAQAKFLLGDWAEATRQAEEAQQRHPDHPGPHVLLGRIAMETMSRLLKRYAELAPTGSEEAQMVAEISAARRKARAAFQRASELDATRAYPHVALSQLASLDHKDDEARRHLLDALAIDPEVPADHDKLTRGMDWQARRDLYRNLRNRFLADTRLPEPLRRKKAATLSFHEGRALLDGHQFEAARTAFRAALRDAPDADNALYYCFLSSYHLKDYDDAEQCAATYAGRSAPGFADVLRKLPSEQRVQIAAMVQWLADRAYSQERIANSRDLNHVTACLLDSADAWNNHAFLCRETGQFEQAFQSYQYAIQREPESPQLWNDAAVVLQYHLTSDENLKRAHAMYQKAIGFAEKVLADRNSDERARAMAQQALRDARANLAEMDKQSPSAAGQNGG